MTRCAVLALGLALLTLPTAVPDARPEEKLYLDPINVHPPHITTDPSVKYDYDIVYVRVPRKGDRGRTLWTDIAQPLRMDPGGDLMLLHPDGREELLVAGGDGSVTDPFVSFDGEWVYYAKFHNLKQEPIYNIPPAGSDIYKIHVRTRKIVPLTHQEFTPNTGAARWSRGCRAREDGTTYLTYGVFNLGPCPLPGGKVIFTSNRNAFRPPRGYPGVTLQLFVMDDDGANVECVGHLNVAGALHPTILTDGRVLFSSLESQGTRDTILWGLWNINPDGRNWGPVLSAFDPVDAPSAFHFQTQLSDGHIVAEEYYNQNNSGFGTFFKLPLQPAAGYPAFGPGFRDDPRNPPLRNGRFYNGKPQWHRLPFTAYGIEVLTPFARIEDGPADPSVLNDKDSPAVGKVTHPSGAPDNNLLCVWSPGPANHQYPHYPAIDGGICLLKDGKPIDEPGQLRLIELDPKYNAQWPRALVPYKRIYGIDEPKKLPWLPNDGRLSPHLPEGTPFGLVGTSSLYKRESYPEGRVPAGKVTAAFAGHDRGGYRNLDPFNTSENGASLNWTHQGADAGLYANDDIHAIRILVQEPTTDRREGFKSGRRFYNHATERLRILGEIPVRKFSGDRQPTDPDGNPDTSFLAKIPADTAFAFQTLDKNGMVLNMAQTWHQLRPGEVRTNCGGCHAHSQQPTSFARTAAAKPDYPVFDLTRHTPLLTTRNHDESGKKWDARNETGLRFDKAVKNVEYFRDVKPILDRSCTACHTGRSGKPAGNLVLDDDHPIEVPDLGKVPGTYYRLALDQEAKFGYKPVIRNGTWRSQNASRYIRKFQSRRSLLIWKVFGRRTDGWSNDDFPTETVPGDARTLHWHGKPVPDTDTNRNLADLDYTGSPMPPPEAVAGRYHGPDGKTVRVPPLSAEDRLTLVRWIDLGCPIDLDYDPAHPGERGYGWMLDDNRPTLTLTYPRAGANTELKRILVGMYDYGTGLDLESFAVVADFPVNGVPAERNLAPAFRPTAEGVWELRFKKPVTDLPRGTLTVSVKDRQGNTSRIDRVFSVRPGGD
jgi:hypothetical protein